MMDFFKLDTNMGAIAGGAAIGAAAAMLTKKASPIEGAVGGAIVAVLLPTGRNLAAKVGLK